jgi:hypothetical protein
MRLLRFLRLNRIGIMTAKIIFGILVLFVAKLAGYGERYTGSEAVVLAVPGQGLKVSLFYT